MANLANSRYAPNSTPTLILTHPVEEFGQDGGLFYSCYDRLAQEIDDDMTTGLKEQLEGLLIFAGLFAGINTAFLALTLPLLTADPADDTNALLAQNNAILSAMSLGRNDSIPTETSPLPSAGFTPSRGVFVVNVLFALSLALAIVASFLAVLGRQWLVYYRKRRGGGPEHQRWEQLGRFLGAERWRMELVLGDILPSLLQIGLVIFCISFILYLHTLNPSASFIVAIPFYLGLSVLVLTAIFTSRDQFCPYQTSLSRLLVWAGQPLWKWLSLIGTPVLELWRILWPPGTSYYKQEIPEGDRTSSLRASAIKRTICTSDDFTTLLSTAANIFAIKGDPDSRRVLSDEEFMHRLLDLCEKSCKYASRTQGHPQAEGWAAVALLSIAAFTHVLLTLYFSIPEGDALANALFASCNEAGEPPWLIPEHRVSTSSPILIRTSLAFSLLRSLLLSKQIGRLSNYLTGYSTALPNSGWQVLPLFALAIQMLPPAGENPEEHWKKQEFDSYKLTGFYTGDPFYAQVAIESIEQVAERLSQHLYGDVVDCNKVLLNILSSASMVAMDPPQGPDFEIEDKARLFVMLEKLMRREDFPAELRDDGRAVRIRIAGLFEDLLDTQAAEKRITTSLLQLLKFFFAELLLHHSTATWIGEDIEVLRFFGPPIFKLRSYGPSKCQYYLPPMATAMHGADSPPKDAGISTPFTALLRVFDDFRRTVERNTQALQRNGPSIRDPEISWCHRREQLYCLASIDETPEQLYVPTRDILDLGEWDGLSIVTGV